jgi:endo-alpha-1,4-polygalactosaminidase (GH114 family)
MSATNGETEVASWARQLRAVMASSFEKQRVMSLAEYRTFKIVEDEIASQQGRYRVLAQTSLGEILRSSDEEAFRAINSKRVDILVIDGGGWPILVIEYQGTNHFTGTAAARDAIKREALRKAGINYLEIGVAARRHQIVSRVREMLGNMQPATARARRRRPAVVSLSAD